MYLQCMQKLPIHNIISEICHKLKLCMYVLSVGCVKQKKIYISNIPAPGGAKPSLTKPSLRSFTNLRGGAGESTKVPVIKKINNKTYLKNIKSYEFTVKKHNTAYTFNYVLDGFTVIFNLIY